MAAPAPVPEPVRRAPTPKRPGAQRVRPLRTAFDDHRPRADGRAPLAPRRGRRDRPRPAARSTASAAGIATRRISPSTNACTRSSSPRSCVPISSSDEHTLDGLSRPRSQMLSPPRPSRSIVRLVRRDDWRARARTSSSSTSKAPRLSTLIRRHGPLPPEQLVPLAPPALRRAPLSLRRRASSTSTSSRPT